MLSIILSVVIAISSYKRMYELHESYLLIIILCRYIRR